MYESVSDEGVCRTAPATPGLLKILYQLKSGFIFLNIIGVLPEQKMHKKNAKSIYVLCPV